MSATFVISLDFELMWGVRDHRGQGDYGTEILGARQAVPGMLKLFRKYGIQATWATVGLLFARNRKQMLDYLPESLPAYTNISLSPYAAVRSEIGENETSDPYHYGRSLVEMIADTEGQELATHTYSHYYCLEPGQTLAAFRADLQAARAIATDMDISMASIVFPRNQMTPEHTGAAADLGFHLYRGNPEHFAYRSRNAAEQTPFVRAFRLTDSILPLSRVQSSSKPEPAHAGKTVNLPASRFLRPLSNRFPTYSALHLRRVMSEMTATARAGQGQIYHLWWHPHNFGRSPEASLNRLEKLLQHFLVLQDRHGMQSRSMNSLAAGDRTDRAPET